MFAIFLHRALEIVSPFTDCSINECWQGVKPL